MDLNYIIVQAGGRGSRMERLTRNKPKALVPIHNLPILFHLFEKYPDKKFIIIGDYKFDVLKRYLAAFAQVDYELVNANGKKGTCGGLSLALDHVPLKETFMLVWSDLILDKEFDVTKLPHGDYVGLSNDFICRWKYEDGVFQNEKSDKYGVAGLFILKDKSSIANVPETGEFVEWLSRQQMTFRTVSLNRTKEYGLISEYNEINMIRCRPFNRIEMHDGYVIKEGIDEQGRQLGLREAAWYKEVMRFNYNNLPKVYSLDPLKIEKINGENVYKYSDIPIEEKKSVLQKIVGCLNEFHRQGAVPYDDESFEDAYLGKTFKRLEKVRELVPFAGSRYVNINGKRCRNVFFYASELEALVRRIKPDKFVFLHGDCTFSNILLKDGKDPVLIDPRGYFGNTQFYGDEAYDWAKLYYSLVGNYDQFNVGNFSLEISEDGVNLSIASSGWEVLEDYFFGLLGDRVNKRQIQLIHAVIWLSLTTYAWEDYDSICGAFYNGLLRLEEVL